MYLVLASLLSLVYAGSFLDLKDIEGQNCDTGTSVYQVTLFEVTPNPPVKNSSLNTDIKGTLSQPETLSSVDVYVIYNGINFYQESFPQSGTYEAGQTAEVKIDVYLPSIAPPGNYSVKTKVKNSNGDYLDCWEYSFSL